MTNLDDLLTQPLANIEDNNFSQRLLQRVNRYYYWRSLVLKSLSVLLTLLFFILSSPAHWLENFNQNCQFLITTLTNLPSFDLSSIIIHIVNQPILATVMLVSIALVFIRLEE